MNEVNFVAKIEVWEEEVGRLFEQRFGFDVEDEYDMTTLRCLYLEEEGLTPEATIDKLEYSRLKELHE